MNSVGLTDDGPAAISRLGLVVPAVIGEAELLADCLNNLVSLADAVPLIGASIVVAWQSDDGTLPSGMPVDGRIFWLSLPRVGVAAARNAALDYFAGQMDALMFVDVSVRPDPGFLRAALPLLTVAPLVSAPVAFSDMPSTVPDGRPGTVSAAFLVFRGFIWSTLFRSDTIGSYRFDVGMGPGTLSRHQAGEDARLLYRVVARLRLTAVPFLPSCPVRRLPRPDLAEKQWRYAYGQGYLVGQYLRYPTSDGRGYFLWRALLFAGRSLVMLPLSSRRSLGCRRLCALWAGLGNRDRSVAPLSALRRGG